MGKIEFFHTTKNRTNSVSWIRNSILQLVNVRVTCCLIIVWIQIQSNFGSSNIIFRIRRKVRRRPSVLNFLLYICCIFNSESSNIGSSKKSDFSNKKFGPELKFSYKILLKLRTQIAERYDQPSGKNHALTVIIIPGDPNHV